MAMNVTFRLPGSTSDVDGQLALDQMAEALVQANVAYLQTHPDTPALYDSGVRYDLGADVQGPWQTVPAIIAHGRGDCEDLAGWRAAEYRVRGVQARMCTQYWNQSWQSGAGRWGVHWKVCLPDGTVEDPSAKLATWAPPVGGRPSDAVWLCAAFFGTLIAAPLVYDLGVRGR